MNTERTLQEIEAHECDILADSKKYRAIRYELNSDFETGCTTVVLTLRHSANHSICRLKFFNAHIDAPTCLALKDAIGLYLMDTSHLGWAGSQRVEVGDWDGGPPIFWAGTVERLPEE